MPFITVAAFVSEKDLARLYKVNVAGTETVCTFCMAAHVPRLIFVSSVAVVSGNQTVPLTEDMPYKTTNLYGLSKMEAENVVLEYRKHGLNAAIIRPSMVYGPGEPHAMPLLLRLLRFGILPVVDGGRNRMHLAYIGNVVNALIEALTNDAFLQGTFFIADDEILTTRQIFETLAQGLGSWRPIVLPPGLTPLLRKFPCMDRVTGFFTKDRVYDIARIRSTGYVNKYSAVESLRSTASSWISRQWK
jgi:nucleoside-diphosphate-sugar epimerase